MNSKIDLLRKMIREEVERTLNKKGWTPIREAGELILNNPMVSAYSQATNGRKIDTWDKAIAVLNSFDIYAEMADDNRAVAKRTDVARELVQFFKNYTGKRDWSKLNDLGKRAVKWVESYGKAGRIYTN